LYLTAACFSNQQGKRLVQKKQEWYAHEEKKFNVLMATTKRLLEALVPLFLEFW